MRLRIFSAILRRVDLYPVPTSGGNRSVSFFKRQPSLLNLLPTDFPETSVRNYHSMLRKIPEQCRSLVLLQSVLSIDMTVENLTEILIVPKSRFGLHKQLTH
jgi:hypothetical protein